MHFCPLCVISLIFQRKEIICLFGDEHLILLQHKLLLGKKHISLTCVNLQWNPSVNTFAQCPHIFEHKQWPKPLPWLGSNKIQSCQLIKKINISHLMRFGWVTPPTLFSLFFSSDCIPRIQTTFKFVGLVITVTWFLLVNRTAATTVKSTKRLSFTHPIFSARYLVSERRLTRTIHVIICITSQCDLHPGTYDKKLFNLSAT